jgi:hypothetical protein
MSLIKFEEIQEGYRVYKDEIFLVAILTTKHNKDCNAMAFSFMNRCCAKTGRSTGRAPA